MNKKKIIVLTSLLLISSSMLGMLRKVGQLRQAVRRVMPKTRQLMQQNRSIILLKKRVLSGNAHKLVELKKELKKEKIYGAFVTSYAALITLFPLSGLLDSSSGVDFQLFSAVCTIGCASLAKHSFEDMMSNVNRIEKEISEESVLEK